MKSKIKPKNGISTSNEINSLHIEIENILQNNNQEFSKSNLHKLLKKVKKEIISCENKISNLNNKNSTLEKKLDEKLTYETKFRKLFQNSNDAILVADDSAKYIEANNAACKLFGKTKKEFTQLHLWDLNSNYPPKEVMKSWKAFLKNGKQFGEFEFIDSKGNTIITEFSAVANFAPGMHLSILRDITKNKKNEIAVKYSEEQLRAVWDSSNDGMRLIDKNAVIIKVNEAYCKMVGKTKEQILNKKACIINKVKDRKRIEQKLISNFQNQKFDSKTEKKLLLWNNQEIWFEISSSFIKVDGEKYLLSQFRDITEKKNSQEKLSSSLTKLYTILDSFPGAVLMENLKRRIEFANETFCRIFEIPLSPEDLAGTDCLKAARESKKLFKKEEAFIRKINSLLKGQKESSNNLLELKSGKILNLTYTPIFKNENLIGHFWFYQDVTKENQLAENLKASENRLRELIDLIPDIVCFKDGNGRWLEANKFDLDLFQISNVDYRGKTDKELAKFSPFYKDAFLSCEDSDEIAWIKKSEHRCEEIIPQPNGREITFDIIKKPSYDSAGNRIGLLVVGRDITERKHAENILIESKRKLDTLINNVPGMVYRCLNDNFWTMKFISNGCLELTGYKPEDIIENKFFSYSDLIIDKDKQLVNNEVQKAIKNNSQFEIEYRIRDKNNKIKWVFEKGCLIKDIYTEEEYLEGIIIDVTEKVIAEQNLKKSQERLTTFYNATFSGTLIHDNGIILDCNKGICDLVGYTREEIIGRNGLFLLPEDELSNVKAIIKTNYSAPYDSKVVHKNGRKIDVRVHGKSIEYFGKEVRFAEYVDITIERRNDKIHKARLKLLEAANNATMDELLQLTLDIVEKLTESNIGFYHFVDDDKKTLTLQAWSTNTIKTMCSADGKNLHYNIDEAGVWVDAIKARKTVIHNNYESLTHKKGLPEGHADVIREMVVPVFRNNKIVAVLGIGNKITDYDEYDDAIVSVFADLAWDITDRKIAQEKLKENEERLRLALKSAEQGLYDLNIQTGEAKVSDEYLSMLGYNPKEFIETNYKWIERLHPDDKERVAKNYFDYINHKKNEYKVEFRQKTADGNYKWILSVGKIIERDKNNNPLRMIGTHTDISKIKAVEEKLRRLTNIHKTLTELATKFVNVPIDKIDDAIHKSFQFLADFFDVDRVYLFEFNFMEECLSNTHEWCAKGISKQISNLQKVPLNMMDSWLEEHFQNKPHIINDINLVSDDDPLKENLKSQGIKSLLAMPIFVNKSLFGFIGFDSVDRYRTWEKDDVNLLKVLAELLSNLFERRKRQTALLESEENFRKLIDNSPDGIGVITDLKVAMVNKSASRILGYSSSDDLLNKSPLEFVHQDSIQTAESVIDFLKSNTSHKPVQIKFKRPDNSIVLCEVQTVVYSHEKNKSILVTIRDITEKIQSEIELNNYKNHLEDLVKERTAQIEQQSQFFKIFINTIPMPAYVKDLDGKYTEVNEAFLKYFEITKEEIIGKDVSFLATKEVVDKSIKNEQILISEKDTISYETYHIAKDGTRRELLIHKAKFCEADNKPLGITGLIVEITNQKKLHEQLIQSYEKEKELNELKTNFISMASHEFRTPLTTILASTELIDLHNRRGNHEKLSGHIGRVQESVSFMNSLLEDMLILSRADKGSIYYNPIEISVKPFLEDLIQKSKLSLASNQIFTFNYFVQESRLIIDPQLISLIIANLIANSIKYSPDGGNIKLDVYSENGELKFIISDEGIGIPERDIKKIFEPFHRGKNTEYIQGSGLGLSVVKSALELHNGNISVESKLNEGTTFTIIIKL